jgi:N-ethylmaleimide reductase
MADADPQATFGHAAAALDRFGLAYLHLVLPESGVPGSEAHGLAHHLRERFAGPLILNGGLTRESGDAVLAEGIADLVSFGSLFLANPDLPERFAEGAPLNAPDMKTFYGGGEQGYTDYPTRKDVSARS